MKKKQLLARAMAFLLCTDPEITLGKLLNFCVASKVDSRNSGRTPLEFAEALLEHPEKLSSWVSAVIDSDNHYSMEEMVALSEMRLDDPQAFMGKLLAELEALDTQGL